MKTIFNNKKNDAVKMTLSWNNSIFSNSRSKLSRDCLNNIFSYIFSFYFLGDNASIFCPRSVVFVIMRDKSVRYRQKSLFVNSVRCDSVKDKHGII